ncbi:hypothetical protein ACWA5Z_06780 [Testudinibacter sp. P80/BLE/0925]
MALIKCPECGVGISDKAEKCLNCGVTIKRAKRTFLGKLFKCAFIIFNIIMAFYLFSIYDRAGMIVGNSNDIPLLARAIINAKINDTLFTWVVGDVILGLFLFFTKPKA